jgi:hypothetical protein
VVAGRCVEFAPVRETGQVVSLRMREVSDQSEIMESLGMSASASVKAILGSGSAQASFARDATVKSNATNLVLEATVENGVLFAGPPDRPPPARKAFPEPNAGAPARDDASVRQSDGGDAVRIKPWAQRLLRSKGARGFHEHCGDSFVSAIFGGAQLLATFRFQEQNAAERETIKAAIRAAYGPSQMSAGTSAKREEALRNTDLTIHYLQVGGGRGTIPISREDLRKKLERLAEEAGVDPKFHAMEITAYASLADWPPSLALPAEAEAADEAIADYYWLLTTLQDDVEDIRREPARFDSRSGLSGKAIADFQDQIISLRGSLLVATEARARAALPESPLNPAVYQFFPRHTLDFQALNSQLPVTAARAAPPVDQWFGDLARHLDASVPHGNPNVLRILLPLPCGVVGAGGVNVRGEDAKSVHRRAVVDWYVRPQSARSCRLDPTDNECLTNAELAALEQYVPYRGGTPCRTP